jgi:hypothetical protein
VPATNPSATSHVKMKQSFLITGLQRSRTAWLANFLTFRKSYCFHEPMLLVDDLTDLPQLFSESGAETVGASSAVLPFYIDKIWPLLPDPKLVIIERNLGDSFQSLLRMLKELPEEHREAISLDAVRDVHEKNWWVLDDVKKKYDALIVPFDALTEKGACRQVWEYCVPNEPFHEARWEMLDFFRIQVKFDEYVQRTSPEAADRLQVLFGAYD